MVNVVFSVHWQEMPSSIECMIKEALGYYFLLDGNLKWERQITQKYVIVQIMSRFIMFSFLNETIQTKSQDKVENREHPYLGYE
jgi:hypothetical protein